MTLRGSVEVQNEFALFLRQNLNKELLRFTTAGSVDDGKSTLIGRLLYDSKTVYEDQLASVRKSRVNRSGGPIDFSLITDGLRAEREQGITIDVGYRYFATARRKFIIADTPGHEQYTRNMATGASTADLALILVDGRKGLLPQTLRHSYISSLLGISTVVAAINKMDLLGYAEEKFRDLEGAFLVLAKRLGIQELKCIPISALGGDNVVERSERMTWYAGPTLLEHLETVPIPRIASTEGFRFPVQYVLRPDANFRGFAGQIAGGVIRPGDEVTALPSGQKSRVESIVTFDGQLPEAFATMSVTLTLTDEIDLSRGDMLVSADQPPRQSRRFVATIVWMHPHGLEPGRGYLIKHCGRQVRGRATRIRHRVNIDTLEPEAAERLHLNEIATVEIETSSPLFFDDYQENRITGSFIVIDLLTNATLGAGMIQADLSPSAEIMAMQKESAPDPRGSPLDRRQRHGHLPAIVLLNRRLGLAKKLERALFDEGFAVALVAKENSPVVATKAAWTALHAAGLVVLYHNPSLGAEERLELRATAGEGFFDFAELNLPVGEAEAIAQFLSLVTWLRISPDKRVPGR